ANGGGGASGEWCEGRAAAGKAGAANVGGAGAAKQFVGADCNDGVAGDRSLFRKVCRAGFAGRGTTLAVFIGRHSRGPFPTRDRVSGRLMQHVLVALRAGGLQLGPLQLHVLLELLLRLADVTLVLEDGGERLGDELLVERLHVEQRERARPVERL